MHDLIIPLDPHGDDVRADVRFEDEAGDAPFEVAHLFVRVLVDFSFREDVDPAVASGGVGGRGGGGGVVGVGVGWGDEGVGDVGGGLGGGGGGGGRGEVRAGEEADGLGHGWLEEAAEGGVGEAVGGEGLAEDEEGGEESAVVVGRISI